MESIDDYDYEKGLVKKKNQVRAISEMLNLSRRTIQRCIKRRIFLDENIEKKWVNICYLPQKDNFFEDVRR